MSSTITLHPGRFAFWQAYFVQMRPYLLFVSGITGLAGLALASDLETPRVLILGVVFFLSYGFGQALTDCFQLDTDSISSPYRPLIQGVIRRQDVLVISLSGLVLSAAIIFFYNPYAVFLASACILGLATYTYFKRKWWAGPLFNAWIVAALFLVAVQAGGAGFSAELISSPPAILAASTVFFGYANFVLTGYFKDVSADAATGYLTLPVRFGRRAAAIVSDGFALLFVGCGLAVVVLQAVITADRAKMLPAFLILSGAVAFTIIGQIRLHRVRRDEESHRAIGPVVRAYILMLAAAATAFQPTWILPVLAFYLVFVVVLKQRPVTAQI